MAPDLSTNPQYATVENMIKGRKPAFGDLEQIRWLKQQRRLRYAAEYGVPGVEIELFEGDDFPSLQKLVKFRCPCCLVRHQIVIPHLTASVDYEARCGTKFIYSGKGLQLREADTRLGEV